MWFLINFQGQPMGWAWSTGTLADVTNAVKMTWGSQGTVGEQRPGTPDAPPGNRIGSFELDMSEGAGFWSFVPIQDSGAGAGDGGAGGVMPGTDGIPGTDSLTEAQREAQFYQSRWEEAMGLPATGRTGLQQYTASLYPEYKAQRGVRYGLEIGPSGEGGYGMGIPTGAATPYSDYLAQISGLPGAETYNRLMDMTPEQEQMLYETQGLDPMATQRAAFRGLLRSRNVAPHAARGLVAQAFDPAAVRAWEREQTVLPAGAGVGTAESYLDALARRYGY